MNIPRLHPDTIEEIKQRIDIVEIISERVVLKKQGREFAGLCPFHDERSPSFTVSPTKQVFHCFGCGAGGDAISFLKQLDSRSFGEVALDLAKRYEVPIRTMDNQDSKEFQRQLSLNEQLFEVMAIAANFFQHALHQPNATKALTYLQEQRGLSRETIQGFGLGYAPNEWQDLYRHLVEVKGYPVSVVEKAGLVIKRKSSGYYDRFRDRLMIPICDIQGRVVGFGGRALGDAKPKYLNSPETPIFEKGNLLFGLDKAKKAIVKQDRTIVVEGYFDAIALHASGVSESVASLGTALSSSQIKRLARYSKVIILNFDTDQAGTTATGRAISEIADLVYQGQIQLRILSLPQSKDADEFLKSSGNQAYLDLVQKASLWIDWQIEQTMKGKDLGSAHEFQEVAQAWVKVLSKIDDPTMRNYYIGVCSEYLSRGNSDRLKLITADLARQVQRLRHIPQSRSNPSIPKIKIESNPEDRLLLEAESLILRIYLHAPEARDYFLRVVRDRRLSFQYPHHQALWNQIKELQESLPIDSTDLISRLQSELEYIEAGEQYHRLLCLQEKHLSDIQKPILSIEKAVLTVEKLICKKRIQYATEQIAKINVKLDLKEYEYFSQQLIEGKKRERELELLRSTNF